MAPLPRANEFAKRISRGIPVPDFKHIANKSLANGSFSRHLLASRGGEGGVIVFTIYPPPLSAHFSSSAIKKTLSDPTSGNLAKTGENWKTPAVVNVEMANVRVSGDLWG